MKRSWRARVRRGPVVLVCGAALVASALACFVVWREARARLEQARAGAAGRDLVRFERERLESLRTDALELFQSTRATRAVERFEDSYFAATDGGLVEMSRAGEVVRTYGALEGLPESDLTCLKVYGARLYVGTRSKGLLAFDGSGFERYRWTDRDAQTVTALLEDGGKLLVGTFGGGLLEFDGRSFREVRAGGARLEGVTLVARHGARLYVGTFASGLWVAEGGRWARFTTADGLLSERVVGVVEGDGLALVATDFGLSAASVGGLTGEGGGARFRALATAPTLSGLVDFGGRVLVCKDDGALALLASPAELSRRGAELVWTRPSVAQHEARLTKVDGRLWLLSSAGLRRTEASSDPNTQATSVVKTSVSKGRGRSAVEAYELASSSLSFEAFGEHDASRAPTSNLISALAFDADGRLWVGSFRDGLDVFASDGRRLAHVEAEAAREVNALVADGRTRGVLAATSRGLLRFDHALRVGPDGAAERLPSSSILHVALARERKEALTQDANASQSSDERSRAERSGARFMKASLHEKNSSGKETARGVELFVATSRGLSVGESGRWRTLTTVQGLPSNSVYAVWSAGAGRAYAGTLGGLVEINAGRVVRVFKDLNSNLTHNWVTAVCEAGGRLFVGTYGGGVFELTPSGELRGFAPETGRDFVNPNAMWADDERLYVGTLAGALVLELRRQRWTRLKAGLPSSTVLSVAGREGHVYFGTTGGLARVRTDYFNHAE